MKVHIIRPGTDRPACNMLVGVYNKLQLTNDREKVTCVRCQRYMRMLRIAGVQ